MAYRVKTVFTGNDFRKFYRFPYRLYRNDPHWIAPLRIEERKQFREKTNPMLLHCEYQHFLLLKDGVPAGRISAFINHLAVKHWGDKVGMFGSYECIEEGEASCLLLETAKSWVHERGMQRMQGPWTFASQECGLVVKGVDTAPMIMAPYNPAYYIGQFENFGLTKEKDLKVYRVKAGSDYTLPDRFLKNGDRIAAKTGVTIRAIDMRNLKEDIRILVDVANRSTADNWGYIPVTDEEADDLAGSLKPVVDPELVMIAEIGGKPVGYMITLPDINVLLKGLNGRLLPRGVFRLLTGIRKIRRFRIWALGVVPEYQRKAIDVLFYLKLHEALKSRMPFETEANYVLEDNMVMNNPILKMGFEESKIYRVYHMPV